MCPRGEGSVSAPAGLAGKRPQRGSYSKEKEKKQKPNRQNHHRRPGPQSCPAAWSPGVTCPHTKLCRKTRIYATKSVVLSQEADATHFPEQEMTSGSRLPVGTVQSRAWQDVPTRAPTPDQITRTLSCIAPSPVSRKTTHCNRHARTVSARRRCNRPLRSRNPRDAGRGARVI